MADSQFFLKNKKYFPLAGIVILAVLALILFDSRKEQGAPGKIVPIASAAEIHQQCENKQQPSEKFDCYEQNFESYMKAKGGRMTLVLLDDLQKMGGYAQSNCHPLSHKVGNIALHVYGSVLNAVPEYLPVCHSGYYHGLLEEYLATAESYEKGVAQVCGTPAGSSYFNWFQCTHGLGHGVMQFRDNELPAALKDCDLVDPANNAREICYAGSFMENITTDEKTGHPAKYMKKEDPIYPCNAVETQYKSACYFLASSQILKLNGWNLSAAMKVCETKAEPDYRWLCFQSIGRDVAGSTLRNIEQVNNLCMQASEAWRSDCFFGAVRDFINEKGEFDAGIKLCDTIHTDYQPKCYDAVLLDLGLFKKAQEYEAECAKMPASYKNQCLARTH